MVEGEKVEREIGKIQFFEGLKSGSHLIMKVTHWI
jgi:hypothetical protein